VAAARLALSRNGLASDDVAAAFAALSGEQYGDGPVRRTVKARADAHDEAYFDAEDAGDGATAAAEFVSARALSALWFALRADPDDAARNALYEARHSVDDAGQSAIAGLIALELDSTG